MNLAIAPVSASVARPVSLLSLAPAADGKLGHAIEDSVNIGGLAATTAGIGSAAAVMAPRTVGPAIGFAVLTTVGGAVAGAVIGDAVTHFAARVSGVSHSQDELIAGPIVGGLAGGAAGLGGAVAGALGASPGMAALVCGGVVLGLGALVTIADAIRH